MRKYLIGVVAGVMLMWTFGAAADTIIGKKIDNTYLLVYEGVQLPINAISVEGTSYAPIRVIGETMGLEVDFENDMVLLSGKKNIEAVSAPVITPQDTHSEIDVEWVESKIEHTKVNIWGIKAALEARTPNSEDYSELISQLERLQKELKQLEEQKSELLK